MKKFILIFLLMAAAVLPFACNSTNKSATTTAGEDSRITSAVKANISADRALNDTKIEVETDNSIVSLKGEVKDPSQEQTAIRVAQKVPGVRTVHSFLKTEPQEGAGSTGTQLEEKGEKVENAAKDAEITAKVKLELAKDKNVSAMDIHVDTVNGVVTLSGEVASKAEIDRAITDTRNIENVKDVNSQLTVKHNS
jgi:hyperosmotically inducible protein